VRSTNFFVSLLLVAAPLLADPRADRWREDLAYLRDELRARHANVFHALTPRDYEQGFADLERRVPQLRDDQIVVEIARLAARIGDGHTGVFFFSNRGNFPHRQLPIELYAATDGWLILATDSEHRELIGSQLLKIGSADPDAVFSAVAPLMPRDNDESLRGRAGRWMVMAELLQTLGFVEKADDVPLVVECADGERKTVMMHPVSRNARIDWKTASEPLWLTDRSTKYWMRYLDESHILFIQFNSADIATGSPEKEFASFASSIVDAVAHHHPEKVIVDLRWNHGGSFERTRYLLWALIRADEVNREGKLFVLLSPGTFSAAVSLATELDQHTNALFVGEVPGSAPNSYGDLGRLFPPNSGIEVRYSRYYDGQSLPDDTRPAIYPDLRAPLSIADYRAGIDPAMTAVQEYAPRTPISEILLPIALQENGAAAIARYRQLERSSYNRYSWSPQELDRVASHLQDAQRLADALLLYRFNSEQHPWWAWGHARLGYALLAQGERDAGMKEYLRAFELDKRMTYYRDELRKPGEHHETR
jgi:hypothetical protein